MCSTTSFAQYMRRGARLGRTQTLAVVVVPWSQSSETYAERVCNAPSGVKPPQSTASLWPAALRSACFNRARYLPAPKTDEKCQKSKSKKRLQLDPPLKTIMHVPSGAFHIQITQIQQSTFCFTYPRSRTHRFFFMPFHGQPKGLQTPLCQIAICF